MKKKIKITIGVLLLLCIIAALVILFVPFNISKRLGLQSKQVEYIIHPAGSSSKQTGQWRDDVNERINMVTGCPRIDFNKNRTTSVQDWIVYVKYSDGTYASWEFEKDYCSVITDTKDKYYKIYNYDALYKYLGIHQE